MTTSIYLTLTIAGCIILIGSLSNYLFKKTSIPDMLFLIGLGIVLGPIFQIVPKETVIGAAPLLATIALLIILFDGGLSLDIPEIVSHAPRALLLAFIGFILNVVVVMYLAKIFLDLRFLYGALLGSILGGSSSIVIVTLAQRMKISNESKVTLMMESAITDVLCTVIALALFHIINVGNEGFVGMGKDIIANFTTGSFVGAVLGIFWLNTLQKLRKESYQYMLTIALMFLGYVLAENIGGSGAIAALIFGIILGNEKGIMKLIKKDSTPIIFDKGMRQLENEIVFLIKSFFFVYLGLIISINNIFYAFVGIIFSILFLILRYISVSIITFKSRLSNDRSLMTYMFTRGLAAAVLATTTYEFNLPISDLFLNIAFVVILTTGIITTIGIAKSSRMQKEPLEDERLQDDTLYFRF